MRLWMLPLALGGVLMFPSCSSTSRPPIGSSSGGYNPLGTGPFDRNGNYVEAWADSPNKWPGGSNPASMPSLAVPGNPASDDSNPPPIASTIGQERGDLLAPRPNPSKPNTPPEVASNPKGKSSSKPKPQDDNADKPASAETSKATAKSSSSDKPKPKSSAPTRYTVKKGDTLYELAKRFKTPVAAIQKANGISGSNIRVGQKLVIPRY